MRRYEPAHAKPKAKLLPVLAAVVLLALLVPWGLMVHGVNAAYCAPDVLTVEQGTVVTLDARYMTGSDECAPGYRVTVSGAHVMTEDGYVQAVSDLADNGEVGADETGGTPCVLVVELQVENTGEREDVGLSPISYAVVGSKKSVKYDFDGELFGRAYPQIGEWCQFGVRPHSSTLVLMPFTLSQLPDYFHFYDEATYAPISAGSYRLLIANQPQRVFMEMTAE